MLVDTEKVFRAVESRNGTLREQMERDIDEAMIKAAAEVRERYRREYGITSSATGAVEEAEWKKLCRNLLAGHDEHTIDLASVYNENNK